jgi:hypothetical protein
VNLSQPSNKPPPPSSTQTLAYSLHQHSICPPRDMNLEF